MYCVKNPSKFKLLVSSLLQNEVLLALGLSTEIFDTAGDTIVYVSVATDKQLSINHGELVVAYSIAFVVTCLVSFLSLSVQAWLAWRQWQARRRDFSANELEVACQLPQETRKQTLLNKMRTNSKDTFECYIAAGSGLLEDLPMALLSLRLGNSLEGEQNLSMIEHLCIGVSGHGLMEEGAITRLTDGPMRPAGWQAERQTDRWMCKQTCIALRCVALRCVALRCVALHGIALYCVTLHAIHAYGSACICTCIYA